MHLSLVHRVECLLDTSRPVLLRCCERGLFGYGFSSVDQPLMISSIRPFKTVQEMVLRFLSLERISMKSESLHHCSIVRSPVSVLGDSPLTALLLETIICSIVHSHPTYDSSPSFVSIS